MAPFVRVRAQGSKAEGYPETFWWSTLGGVELDIADIVSLYLAYGPAGYVNTDDDEWWMYPELGASCHF